jgi:3-isopropylmalate dehydrogenase
MRQLFDLYICFRPIKAYPGNRLNYREGIDLAVFRENTGPGIRPPRTL